MAPEKSPAFQFYPKDYLSDPRVRVLTFEQRGLYWEAVSICWLEGSIPADVPELAAILGASRRRLEHLWPRIAKCFEQHGERLTHKRLDKERKAQADSRQRRTDAAAKRWEKEKADALHKQTECNADAKQCSSSASASATAVIKDKTPLPPANAGGVRILREHKQKAEAVLKAWMGYCKHDSPCESEAACRALLELDFAQKAKAS